MKHFTQFINLEEDDKDLIVSFAVDDTEMGVKSLILHRTLLLEHIFDESERGVMVSLEGDYFDNENSNVLINIKISDKEIHITSSFREYDLDISHIEKSEIEEMQRLLNKQNYDNSFTIQIA